MSGDVVGMVLTLNEEDFIEDCLRSLKPLCTRMIVLDSGSTDRTVELAEALGAEVVTHPFVGYASQRNYALDLARDAEWLVFLDADERLTVHSRREIEAALARDVSVMWLPRRNFIGRRELKGGGWWPDRQPRVVRPDRVRYDLQYETHERLQITGTELRLNEPFIHLNYGSLAEFREKQRYYTNVRMRTSTAIPRLRAYIGAPLREFMRRFLRLQGFRDGGLGLKLAAILAWQELRFVWLARRR